MTYLFSITAGHAAPNAELTRQRQTEVDRELLLGRLRVPSAARMMGPFMIGHSGLSFSNSRPDVSDIALAHGIYCIY
jgi:hypothetical protein